MKQHTEDFDRLAENVWTHFPFNGVSRDGLEALGRISLRLTLACEHANPFWAEPAKYALYSLQNFLRSESFGNDERLTAICLAGYLREAVPALESNCPTLKEAG